MIEQKIGGVEFTDRSSPTDPYIIGVFGEEMCGKTRFALTGPEIIGMVVLEQKSYLTIKKDAADFGKKVYMPKDQNALMVPQRLVASMSAVDQQMFYKKHVGKVRDVTYALLENKDVKVVCIDKATALFAWMDFAINGTVEKFIKVDGHVMRPVKEFNQYVIDFINSLSQFGKTVILNCASKDDYEVLGADRKPYRKTYEGFKYLGSHCNVIVEMIDNKQWNPDKSTDSRHNWRFRLNMRRCQQRPELEGPSGNPLLTDDEIVLPRLIQSIDPNADIEMWL